MYVIYRNRYTKPYTIYYGVIAPSFHGWVNELENAVIYSKKEIAEQMRISLRQKEATFAIYIENYETELISCHKFRLGENAI